MPDETAPRRGARDILADLTVSSGALSALLITRDGHKVAEAGTGQGFDTTALAALIAGMFAATREVARIIGEQQVAVLLQQGARRHIHISLVSDRVMLVLIFENYQRIGLVRHEARKAVRILAEILREQRPPPPPEVPAGVTVESFREYALNLIDRIFDAGGHGGG